MNEKTEPEKEYPYIDRPMWLYSRSSDKKILALMQQMHELLEEAQRRSYTVVGTSQDMGTGRSMAGITTNDALCERRSCPCCACSGFNPPEPRSRRPNSNTGIFAGPRYGTNYH